MNTLTPHQLLAAGRLAALKAAPYFRALILGLRPVEAPGLGTIGVSEHGTMLWDPEFIAEVGSAPAVAGLLVHEAQHVLKRHVQRVRGGGLDPRRGNIAGDLTINPSILAMGLELPTGKHKGCFPKDFGFDDGLTMEEYYRLLSEKEAADEAKGKPQDGEGDDDDKPHAGGGWCGSCAGRPMPGEPDGDSDSACTPAELERAVREVAQEILDAATKKPGSVPAELARTAALAVEPARVPWQRVLASAVRSSVAWRPGAVAPRYDAPGRRQAGVGYGAGRPVLPRLRTPAPNVGVIVDTSGSMGRKDLEDALVETRGILRAVGAHVTLGVCDCSMQGLRKITKIGEATAMLKGGGGTDMRPAFEALAKQRPAPEVIVCITDGWVGDGVPRTAPRGTRVIWVLVGKDAPTPAPWGTVVRLAA